jgi:peptidoglycan/xylan/chitin deacetylase (PgdA/CDA1 family)
MSVRPIVPITMTFSAGAVAAAFLPSGLREWAWSGLALGYLAIGAWGASRLDSGIFVKAFTHGSRERREVALTFDDGPDPRSTPPLLDLLRNRGVAAAFFLVGEKVRLHPRLARRCGEEGHLLGNHSNRHSVLTNFLIGGPLRREISVCQDAIESAAGVRPAFYRPPFGLINHALEGAARDLGLEVVGWEARGMDLRRVPPEAAAARILARARPGCIILLHDGGREPARVLEVATRVLDGLRSLGLSPVRLDRLAR